MALAVAVGVADLCGAAESGDFADLLSGVPQSWERILYDGQFCRIGGGIGDFYAVYFD